MAISANIVASTTQISVNQLLIELDSNNYHNVVQSGARDVVLEGGTRVAHGVGC